MSVEEPTPEQADELLKLENQLCFPLYVCSKEVIKKYRPLLEPLGLTYTGYITMMALWEQDHINVKELGRRLYLDSGTLTPLLKRLEKAGYITRNKDPEDERSLLVDLTPKGKALKQNAACVPLNMIQNLSSPDTDLDAVELKKSLDKLMVLLTEDPSES